MKTNTYVDYILDALSQCGSIKSRKMFGGYGIYKDNYFFAIIANNILYFKTDGQSRSLYQSYGSKPFSYEGKNGNIIEMNYWEVPVDILEDHQMLNKWVSQAVAVAQRAKINKS